MREIIVPSTPREAAGLLGKGIFLQGGTDVLRLGGCDEVSSPLIDLRNAVSDVIAEDHGTIEIGARATFTSLVESSLVPSWLRQAALYMASLQLRNQATIGGNIALGRDDSYLVPSLVAAGAVVGTMDETGKSASMPISEYLKGEKKLLLLSVSFARDADVHSKRLSLASHSHAVITAASGPAGYCFAIKGTGIVEDIEGIGFASDMFGSAEYKKYLASTLLEELSRR